jgi:hypothetical protein
MASASFARVTVGTSPTLVASWQRGENPFLVRLFADPAGGANACFIGDASVTASTGFRLPSEIFDVVVPVAERGVAATTEDIYAVASSGSALLYVAIDPS